MFRSDLPGFQNLAGLWNLSKSPTFSITLTFKIFYKSMIFSLIMGFAGGIPARLEK